jgi:hypothetical protein
MALGGPNIYPSSGFWMGISREYKSEVSEDTPTCCDPLMDDSHPTPDEWLNDHKSWCEICGD